MSTQNFASHKSPIKESKMRKPLLFTALIVSAFIINSLARADIYEDCKTVLENEPDEQFCFGFVKGFEIAISRTSGTVGSGTGGYQRETIVYELGKTGASNTVGKSLEDKIAVTLDPGFKQRKEAGELNWAGVSDLKLKQEVKTNTVTQPGRADSFTLQQSQMSVQEYLNNGGNKKSMEDLEEKVKALDNNSAYTIYLQRPD